LKIINENGTGNGLGVQASTETLKKGGLKNGSRTFVGRQRKYETKNPRDVWWTIKNKNSNTLGPIGEERREQGGQPSKTDGLGGQPRWKKP